MKNNFYILSTQLFDPKYLPLADNYIILDINDYYINIHKMLLLRAASLKYYQELTNKGLNVNIIHDINLKNHNSKINSIFQKSNNINNMFVPADMSIKNLLDAYIDKYYPSPMFILNRKDIAEYMHDKDNKNIDGLNSDIFIQSLNNYEINQTKIEYKLKFTTFYIHMRKRLNLLIDKDDNWIGGKLTFDIHNREKFPKNYADKTPSNHIKEHIQTFINLQKKYGDVLHGERKFADINESDFQFIYKTSRKDIKEYVYDFIKNMRDFGKYEDAIGENIIFAEHSIISPYINIGLITPIEILDMIAEIYPWIYTRKHNKIPDDKNILYSVEGFIRQIIGWREYMNLGYVLYITNNGIVPDINILSNPKNYKPYQWNIAPNFIIHEYNKLLIHSYSHHIVRLMLFGAWLKMSQTYLEYDNIKNTYEWFMRHYIDAYEWVMIGNVFFMLYNESDEEHNLMTRPYVSGYNYIEKMYRWDNNTIDKNTKLYNLNILNIIDKSPQNDKNLYNDIFYRYIGYHKEKFAKNYSMAYLVKLYNAKTNEEKKRLTGLNI